MNVGPAVEVARLVASAGEGGRSACHRQKGLRCDKRGHEGRGMDREATDEAFFFFESDVFTISSYIKLSIEKTARWRETIISPIWHAVAGPLGPG